MGLSRNKVAVPEGAAGTPPFWRGCHVLVVFIIATFRRGIGFVSLLVTLCSIIDNKETRGSPVLGPVLFPTQSYSSVG